MKISIVLMNSFIPSPVMLHSNSFKDRHDVILGTILPQGGRKLLINEARNRRFHNVFITKRWIIGTDIDLRYKELWPVGAFGVLPLYKNVKLAQNQILNFLKTVREITSMKWDDYAIDDQIAKELRRINILQQDPERDIINVTTGRVTASIGEFKRLLARHPVRLTDVFAPAWLITNEVILMLPQRFMDLRPILTNDGQIPTAITEEFLKSPILKEPEFSLRGFLNLNLTFPAILKLAKDNIAEGVVKDSDDVNIPCLGIIGYQEMPAILDYYLSLAWLEWESTLCYTNNNYHLELREMFCPGVAGQPHFAVSLDRDVNGVVKNAVIPEQLVKRKTFEEFKELVQACDSNTPIESVVPNRIKFDHLSVHTTEKLYDNYLRVFAFIDEEGDSQNIVIEIPIVDESSTENIIAKILKSCSTICSLHLWISKKRGDYKGNMTDRLFNLLLEHAVSVEIKHEWSMRDQLSDENLQRLHENKTAGLFKNLKI